MSLDLSPEVESLVLEYAASEGVNPSEAINRLLRSIPPKETPQQAAKRMQGLLAQWQRADSTPTAAPAPNDGSLTPSEALFHQWEQEALHMTDEERQAESELWQQFQTGINAERHASGQRLVF